MVKISVSKWKKRTYKITPNNKRQATAVENDQIYYFCSFYIIYLHTWTYTVLNKYWEKYYPRPEQMLGKSLVSPRD